MSDGWLNPDKYEHVPILGCTGPGTMMEGYSWKFVGHTTESAPGSMDGVINLFRGKPCYCPQFGYDPKTRRRVQFIPWTWSGAALRGGRDGIETNRGRAVQMEICDYAANTANWSDECLGDIADIIADLIRDGCPINPDNYPDYPAMSGTRAVENSPYRLSGDAWRTFDGLGAHIIVPFNDHYDWDHVNAGRIAEHVHAILGSEPGPPPSRPPDIVSAPAANLLAIGAIGGVVAFAQQLIIGMGYDCGVFGADGVFGPDTRNAVIALQRDHGLDPDGIIGPLTQSVIGAAYGSGPGVVAQAPPWPGRYLLETNPMIAGDDVAAFQRQAAARGHNVGGIDGIYGPLSRDGCLSVQNTHGLRADGVVGPLTWSAVFGE